MPRPGHDAADEAMICARWTLYSLNLRGGLDPLVSHALIFPTLVQITPISIPTSANMRYVTFKVKIGIARFSKYDILTQLLYIPNVVPTAPLIVVGKLPKFFMQSGTGVEVSWLISSTVSRRLLPSQPPIMRV